MNSSDFFERAKQKTILVIGDLMLDRYVFGKSERMSPEAPVPVVDVEREESRLGGAANVALNLQAFGCNVKIAGIVGDDAEGKAIIYLLGKEEIDTDALLSSGVNRTTVKTRIICDGKHMLRLDREQNKWTNEEEKKVLSGYILLAMENCDAIVIEDYDKGVLSDALISGVIASAQKKNIPVVVDPKSRNFFSYANSSIFKPNLKELNEALGLNIQKNNENEIRSAILKLRSIMPHEKTVLTLGDAGLAAMDESGNFFHTEGKKILVKDVSGAGDAVAATLGIGLACGLEFRQLAELANIAGAIACEDVGVSPVKVETLKKNWK